jgi:hypothetical protein
MVTLYTGWLAVTTLATHALDRLTVSRRLWRTRGVSLYLVLALAVPLIQLQVVSVARSLMHGADLQLEMNESLELKSASPAWPGTRPGDRVLAVNGRPIDPAHNHWNRVESLPPGPVTLRLARGAEVWETTSLRPPKSGAFAIGAWIRIGTGLILFLIAIAAFLASPGTRPSWLFFGFCYALALAVQLEYLSYSFNVLYPVMYVDLPLTCALGLQMFAIFPRPIPELAGRRLLLVHALLASLSVVATGWALGGFAWAPGAFAVKGVWAGLLFTAVLMLVTMIVQYRRVRRDGDREAVSVYRALLVALVMGIVLPAALTAGMRVLNLWPNLRWVFQLSVATTVVFAAVTAYALVRHNPLKVDRFTAAIIGYVVTMVTLLAGFGATLLMITQIGSGDTSPVVYVLLSVIATLSLRPAYRVLKRRVDKLFFREAIDDARSLDVLQRLVKDTQGRTRADALGSAMAAVGALQPDGIAIWVLADDGKSMRRSDASGTAAEATVQEVACGSPLGAAMLADQHGGLRGLAPQLLTSAAQEQLWSLGLAMVAPLRAHGAILGFIGVGRRRSGWSYHDTDQTFLNAVAAQVASIVTRPEQDAHVGRYRIERRLGLGGMAEVFLAWQLGPGGFERRVALKRPLPELTQDPTCRAMFLDEARIASQLHHHNIAQIFEIDRHQGAYFIAMEFVDGPSLRDLIRIGAAHRARVPLPIALAIAHAILAALAHAHDRTTPTGEPMGLVHRDVTPSNVQLTLDGEVKLLDFGIARAGTQLYRTQTGVVRGTVPYMSPEHAVGDAFDHRADLFSAGALLHELLTYCRAFPAGPRPDGLVPASTLNPSLPRALDAVLAKAMAFDAADRYPSADAFAEALDAALAPITAASERDIAVWIASLPREPAAEPVEADGDAPTAATAIMTIHDAGRRGSA